MYGNNTNISKEEIYNYLKLLDTFKEEESYSLDEQSIINLYPLAKCKK